MAQQFYTQVLTVCQTTTYSSCVVIFGLPMGASFPHGRETSMPHGTLPHPQVDIYTLASSSVLDCNMPPIRLREGLAFPRDVPSAKHKGHPEEKPSRKRMGGIPFSLKLEGQDWQCIFHAFPLGAGQITQYPCSPTRCGKAWVFLPARCGKAWLFLYLTLLSIYNGGLALSR